ncbi:MAG: chemotaxis response regulator protein-glutamate methylesterase [Desulfobulbaceae bacterium]|nr:MAG: chemotaxis response regulator protein-glutamate methylesterase [Desulfobulbaceae bacterium]
MVLKKKIKVLVVDDTIVYRKAVSDIINELPNTELVGVAHNGKIALSKIASLKPDLITLDVEMPVMNGIEVLSELQKMQSKTCAIMLSTLTSEGSDMTLKALELGAFDFILKPQQSASQAEGKKTLKALLEPIITAFGKSTNVSSILRSSSPTLSKGVTTTSLSRPAQKPLRSLTPSKRSTQRTGKSEIVTIGISTGGPNALGQMLPYLPGDIGVPVLIVQHMPPVFTKSLAASLDKKCALTVKEAKDREPIQPNTVYIAPGGKQMKLAAGADGQTRQIKITDDPPENSCKPAVDYLFRSVGDYYVNRTTAVIMTGMGSDGTKGLEVLKNKGAIVIAQNEATCVVYGMPKAPIEQGLADKIVPLNKIADEIVKTVK